jgi:hypothetical protein
MTMQFPRGTGNSPKVWTPTPDPLHLVDVRAGTWVRVELSYRDTNTHPVPSVEGAPPAATGFFQAHVLYTPSTDDSIFQKEGGRLQPAMFGGSATKQPTSYHVDPGWTFQASWDGKVSIVSGGRSHPDVRVDVIVKLGYTPEALTTLPGLSESILDGLVITEQVHSQRVYAPPVVGHAESVPATYLYVPADEGLVFPAGNLVPFPPGATAVQVTSDAGLSVVRVNVLALGTTVAVPLDSGNIEALGSLTQGGGTSTDGVPARWTPLGADVRKVVVWSKLGN